MAQFARPSADTYVDNWQEDDGTADSLFGEIDESIADDADFIRTQLSPTSDVYVTKLTSVTDPLSSSGHVVRYRYGKSLASGEMWENLLASDVGEAARDEDAPDRSVQVFGAFGAGGSLALQGSNDGVTWATLHDPQGNDLAFAAAGIEQILEATKFVRPVAAGDGTTDLTVIVFRV